MSSEMFVTSGSPLYKHVVNYIHQVWGSNSYFPGPQPVSIEYKHFPILKRNEYVVCEKTDGERHMLVATMFEGKKKCLFVNRAFDMIDVSINLPKKAYEGTILDGELYENTLMIYDALLINAAPVGHLNLYQRLAEAEKLVKFIICMKSDKHRLKMKNFWAMKDFDPFMYEYLPKVEQKVDGLVFTPVNEPVRLGTHASALLSAAFSYCEMEEDGWNAYQFSGTEREFIHAQDHEQVPQGRPGDKLSSEGSKASSYYLSSQADLMNHLRKVVCSRPASLRASGDACWDFHNGLSEESRGVWLDQGYLQWSIYGY